MNKLGDTLSFQSLNNLKKKEWINFVKIEIHEIYQKMNTFATQKSPSKLNRKIGGISIYNIL